MGKGGGGRSLRRRRPAPAPEPKLPRRAVNDLELPDCYAGFYDSLVVFDHHLGKTFVVSTGLGADGSRSEKRAGERMEFRKSLLATEAKGGAGSSLPAVERMLVHERRARSDAPYLACVGD